MSRAPSFAAAYKRPKPTKAEAIRRKMARKPKPVDREPADQFWARALGPYIEAVVDRRLRQILQALPKRRGGCT